jgi:circadian clock protein KaiC
MGTQNTAYMIKRLSTGIEGLDEILHGGLMPAQSYLVRGCPGAGKTTLALQFLMEGLRRGEPGLYVTLNESEAELRAGAAEHGWDLGDLEFLEILPGDEDLSPEFQYSVFHPGDVDLAPTTGKITEAMERRKPARVAFDSLTEVRLLSRDSVRYRRQVLALKEFLRSRGATTLFLGESTHPENDVEAATIVHGVISLEQSLGPDGMDRRSLRVEKYRSSDYLSGLHAARIVRGGLEVYPRLVAPLQDPVYKPELLPSGIPALDRLFGGGLDRGTCTMIGGNSGVGKSCLGMAFLAPAAASGERCVLYTFDEWPAEAAYRSESIGLDVRESMERDLLFIQKVNPLGLPPEQFCHWVRTEVDQRETRMVMIDTVNGYELCTRDKVSFLSHLQQLVGFLKARGVTLLLVNELAKLTGDLTLAETGLSYIADNTVLLKTYEDGGALRKAIAVTRKRLGPHDDRFHEFGVTPSGLQIGAPLTHLRGILGGEPNRQRNPEEASHA